ncbi:MAG: metal-dependent hydrolase [Chlorobi bacterium]|nr:metal-dependent hydrolase [Chlorobiota bacterium]
MKVQFLGHASLLIESEGKKIIVDPFISGNPAAQGKIDVDSIVADYILVTHAHQDHILDVERIAARNPGLKLVSNFEIVNYFGQRGIDGHPMNHGGSWDFDFGRVTYVNAIHTSSFPDGSYGGQPGGFVIESEGKALYIAGDTALTYDMKTIPMMTRLDAAFLPVGDNFTMGPGSAAIAADFIGLDRVIGYHFDTFDLIKIDHAEAKEIFRKAGKELILPSIGDIFEI